MDKEVDMNKSQAAKDHKAAQQAAKNDPAVEEKRTAEAPADDHDPDNPVSNTTGEYIDLSEKPEEEEE